MKTDLVEIFQTIRASLQPYAARGYNAHQNSETEYDLWSEKNIIEDGKKTTERFFCGIFIKGDLINVKINENTTNDQNFNVIELSSLNDSNLKEIENTVAIAHNSFKEKEWV